ncbi:hypothetical protein [Extensimonas vulgaris]|uniref:hypothetical protein n=1 Tax=Extensimonas vulgaris TaxID=1031594 RepID=UPI00119EFAD5|nr:hypothetical protein [Extensimonas vulgaris]
MQAIDFSTKTTHCQNFQQVGSGLSSASWDKHVDKFWLVLYGCGKPLICRAAQQIASFSCTQRGRKKA